MCDNGYELPSVDISSFVHYDQNARWLSWLDARLDALLPYVRRLGTYGKLTENTRRTYGTSIKCFAGKWL